MNIRRFKVLVQNLIGIELCLIVNEKGTTGFAHYKKYGTRYNMFNLYINIY